MYYYYFSDDMHAFESDHEAALINLANKSMVNPRSEYQPPNQIQGLFESINNSSYFSIILMTILINDCSTSIKNYTMLKTRTFTIIYSYDRRMLPVCLSVFVVSLFSYYSLCVYFSFSL